MTPCRLIIDPPRPGSLNMAIDESLLTSRSEDSPATLRIYRWSEPTLSLGYFQQYASRETHDASRDCACVRRHSGGGAIVHDQELTYSLIVPVDDRWSRQVEDLYQLVHGGLIAAYKTFGIQAELAEDGDKQPFLCFQRRSNGDILVGNHKITGSAQRRNRGTVLQHGSILLAKSNRAPELPGLKDLGTDDWPEDAMREACTKEIATALSLELRPDALTATELGDAEKIESTKFAEQTWTKRR